MKLIRGMWPSMVCLFGLVLAPGVSSALVVQSVDVYYQAPGGSLVRDSDSVTDSGGPITTSASAAITGSWGEGVASIGPAGNLGMRSVLGQTGGLYNEVVIQNDTIPNLSNSTRHAVANFIIDGGRLGLIGGVGSRVDFRLELESVVFSANGTPVAADTWASHITLEQLALGALPVASFTGVDIGATVATPAYFVDIPVSAQSFDLGNIPGNGHVALRYTAFINIDGVEFVELAIGEFSDPLNVAGLGEMPTVRFSAPVTPDPDSGRVPAPMSLMLMLCGLAALRGVHRSRG